MNKAEAKAKLEKIIHEDCNLIKTIDAQRAVILCLELFDEYAQQASREAFKAGYGYGIVHDENNPNVHSQEKRAWNIFNQTPKQ